MMSEFIYSVTVHIGEVSIALRPCLSGENCLHLQFSVISGSLIELESAPFGLHCDPFSVLEIRGEAYVTCLIEWHLIDLVSQCETRFNLY